MEGLALLAVGAAALAAANVKFAPATPAPAPAASPPPAPTPPPSGSLPVLDAFVAAHDGQFVNPDHDPYGAQCVELANLWCLRLGIEEFPGDAGDFVFDRHPDCDYIANTPTNFPLPGDIVVWGRNPGLGLAFGHVGVCLTADPMHLTTFDQNWPLNSPCHRQPHGYAGVTGWMRPRVLRARAW